MGEIENLRDETEDKLNNIPDNLQNSQVAELLQSRVDSLQEWYVNLEGIDIDIDDDLGNEEKEKKRRFLKRFSRRKVNRRY